MGCEPFIDGARRVGECGEPVKLILVFGSFTCSYTWRRQKHSSLHACVLSFLLFVKNVHFTVKVGELVKLRNMDRSWARKDSRLKAGSLYRGHYKVLNLSSMELDTFENVETDQTMAQRQNKKCRTCQTHTRVWFRLCHQIFYAICQYF